MSTVSSGVLSRSGRAGEPMGLRSRFTDLDRVLRSFERGGLLVVAGSPATGKTGIAANIANPKPASTVVEGSGTIANVNADDDET